MAHQRRALIMRVDFQGFGHSARGCLPARQRLASSRSATLLSCRERVELTRNQAMSPELDGPLYPLANLAVGSGWPIDQTVLV